MKDIQQQVLDALKTESRGLPRDAAAGIIAGVVDLPIADVSQALYNLALQGSVKSRVVDGQENVCHFENAASTSVEDRIPDLLNHGPPDSSVARRCFDEFVRKTREPISIFLAITVPDAITGLTERTESGRETILYMPSRSLCNAKDHYDDVLVRWVEFRRGLHPKSRQHVHLRLVRRNFPELETTAISRGSVRMNCRSVPSETSRNGVILEADSANSLFKAYQTLYRLAHTASRPSFRFSPMRATIELLKSAVPLLVGTLCMLTAFLAMKYPFFSSAFLGIATGVLSNLATDYFRGRRSG